MKASALTLPPFGDPSASPDSIAYAVYVRDQANACLHASQVDREGAELYVKLLHSHQLFVKLQREDGKPFRNWTEFCLTSRPFGLGRSPQDLEAIIREAKDPATLADAAKSLSKNGERGNGRSSFDIIKATDGGTSASYLTARIARDCPEVLEEMKAGKYPSVRAAARAAGVLKEATGLDLLKRAWGKASPDEREAFLAWVEE